MHRLLPDVESIARFVAEVRGSGRDMRVRLQVVREFESDEGEEEELTELTDGDQTFVKLAGQHQLLGWHLDRPVLDFLQRTSAELHVDEYG